MSRQLEMWRVSMKRALLMATALFLLSSLSGYGEPDKVQHHARAISGRYMVVLADNIPMTAYDDTVQSLRRTYRFKVVTEWRDLLHGFVCIGLTASHASQLANDP